MLKGVVMANTPLCNPSNDSLQGMQKHEVEVLISRTKEEKSLIEAEIERV